MSAVTTTINQSNGGVRITWSSPYSNSDPITKYKIEILDKLGNTWNEDLTNCDGSQSIIISALTCVIPMSVLRASPFSLVYGDLV